MAYKPFKMKGNPMQRNYGIGSPAKQGLILKDSEKRKEYEKNRNTKTVNIKDIKGLEPSTNPTRPKKTDMKKEKSFDKFIKEPGQVVGPKSEFDKFIDKKPSKKVKSPAKQGYRSPDLDYSDPEVLRKEKEGNQRIHDIIAGKYDKDKKRKKKEPTRPPKKKSPAKQGLILDKRTKEQKAKDQKSKELWDKTVNIDDVPGVGGGKSKMQKQMEGRKTDMKKEKSPGKWVQFIPMALSALSSMKKK